jgi:hypothetical protein
MASIQLSAAFNQLEYRLKDISDVGTNTRLQWANQVNLFIYRELVKEDPEKYISEDTVNITANTNAYALPSDFMHVNAWGCGLFEPDSSGNETNRRWTLTSFGSPKTGYYIEGSNLVLTPDPYPNADTATLRYIPNPTRFTATTDYFTQDGNTGGTIIIDDLYMDYLVNALQVQYMIWDDDPSLESLSDIRFVRALNELLANVRREPTVYMLPEISEIY